VDKSFPYGSISRYSIDRKLYGKVGYFQKITSLDNCLVLRKLFIFKNRTWTWPVSEFWNQKVSKLFKIKLLLFFWQQRKNLFVDQCNLCNMNYHQSYTKKQQYASFFPWYDIKFCRPLVINGFRLKEADIERRKHFIANTAIFLFIVNVQTGANVSLK